MAVAITSDGVSGLTFPSPISKTNSSITIGSMSVRAFSSGVIRDTGSDDSYTIKAPSSGTYFQLFNQFGNGSGVYFTQVSGGATLTESGDRQYARAAIFRIA